MTLDQLEQNKSGRIITINGTGSLRHHLLDMGLTPGTVVTLRKVAPMGDPVQIEVRGYELTLRLSEAENIVIEETEAADTGETGENSRKTEPPHLGLGELGRAKDYHSNKIGDSIQKGEPIKFALAGNQNCGKTTLFNRLTGSKQRVGNFPGVTVDRKDGNIIGHPEATVTDLPGIYSLSPYSSEEIVTREFLLNEKPDGIINIIDASNIERNLCLTLQLMELGIPIVLALNMMDEVRENGGTICINELEQILGIPVVPISAAKNEGIEELIEHALHVARYREAPGRQDFCIESEKNSKDIGPVLRCLHEVRHLLEPFAKKYKLPLRFIATKVLEKDTKVLEKLDLPKEEQTALESIIITMEKDTGLDREAAIANMRFNFIENLCRRTVVKPKESREHKRSVKIDKILTGKYTAIPCFIGIMAVVFLMTFEFIGAWLSDLMEFLVDQGISTISYLLETWGVNPFVQSLVTDGILQGIGSVLSFLPTIVTLFFFLSILEDTGYMARVAFVMDKLLRKIGLSGRSFVPMLMGFGCSVPAIMATRTLPSDRDRKMTIFLTPFMSCNAKLPIYALFTAVFFPEHAMLVIIGLYLLGMLCGIIYALILKKTAFKGEPVPFVMELPNYRFPSLKSVMQLIWEKAKGFIQKAFTIIFAASVVIWFFNNLDIRLNVVDNPENSILAWFGSIAAPIFKPLGFGDWKAAVALVTGFMAKEQVVATLTVLLGDESLISTMFTPFTAFVFLVFNLLYTPCVAAIATVKRELGGMRAAISTVLSQCAIAWLMAFLVRCIGLALGFA